MDMYRETDMHMEIASYALLAKGIILAFEAKIMCQCSKEENQNELCCVALIKQDIYYLTPAFFVVIFFTLPMFPFVFQTTTHICRQKYWLTGSFALLCLFEIF